MQKLQAENVKPSGAGLAGPVEGCNLFLGAIKKQKCPAFQQGTPFRKLNLSLSLVSFDHPIFDVNDAMGVLRDVVLVGYEDNGISLSVETVKQGHDVIAGLRVEVASRFVGKNDGGLVHQRPGNRHSLPLSAGQFVGLVHHP